jgi:hypothetical protein
MTLKSTLLTGPILYNYSYLHLSLQADFHQLQGAGAELPHPGGRGGGAPGLQFHGGPRQLPRDTQHLTQHLRKAFHQPQPGADRPAGHCHHPWCRHLRGQSCTQNTPTFHTSPPLQEGRWLNGSATDFSSAVTGSSPTLDLSTANTISS